MYKQNDLLLTGKRVLSVCVAFILLFSDQVFGLAVMPASENPQIKREILAALARTNIKVAESEYAAALLQKNDAECVLLSSGNYLVSPDVARDDQKLIRAIWHEDIEAVMAIIYKTDPNRYQAIKELVLKAVPPAVSNLNAYFGGRAYYDDGINLYVNHIVATYFEWTYLLRQKMVREGDLPLHTKTLMGLLSGPVSSVNGSCFGDVFLDSGDRSRMIKEAINGGMLFYQTYQAKGSDPQTLERNKLIAFLSRNPKVKMNVLKDAMGKDVSASVGDENGSIGELLKLFVRLGLIAVKNTSEGDEIIVNYPVDMENDVAGCFEGYKNEDDIFTVAEKLAEIIERRESLRGYDRDRLDKWVYSESYRESIGLYDAKQLGLAVRIYRTKVIPKIKEILKPDEAKELIRALDYFLMASLDDMVKGKANNPIHHNMQVLENMLSMLKESGPEYKAFRTVRNMAVLALMHDIGNAYSGKKIIARDISSPGDVVSAILARQEHMESGAVMLGGEGYLNNSFYEKILSRIKVLDSEIKALEYKIENETDVEEKDKSTAAKDAKVDEKAKLTKAESRKDELLPRYEKGYLEIANEAEALGKDKLTGGPVFTSDDIKFITEAVRVHDNPSIADYMIMEAQKAIDAAKEGDPNLGKLKATLANNKNEGMPYLFITGEGRGKVVEMLDLAGRKQEFPFYDGTFSEDEAFLVAMFREADRVWMLSQDGLIKDVHDGFGKVLKKEKDSAKSPADQLTHNLKRHREEAQLYEAVLGKDEQFNAEGFGSIEPGEMKVSLYRTPAGLKIAKSYVKNLRSLVGIETPMDEVQGAEQVVKNTETAELTTQKALAASMGSPDNDVDMLRRIEQDLCDPEMVKNISYDIKYDESRLSEEQISVISLYAERLEKSLQCNIKLKPFSSEKGSKESIIAIYAYDRGGADITGEGHMEIAVKEGDDIKDYALSLTGVLNMAFVIANIPSEASEGEIREQYLPYLNFLKDQAERLVPGQFTVESLLKNLRQLNLYLPPAMKFPADKLDEFYRLALKSLRSA